MQTLLVAPDVGDLPGQRRYVEALAAHLPAQGIQLRVVHLRRPGWAHGATVRTAAALASYRSASAARLPGDVLHGTDTFCTVRGVDVLTVHDLIPLQVAREPTAKAHARLFRRRIAEAEVITLTHAWAERIRQAFDLDRDQLHIVPQGCDVPPTRADDHPRPAAFHGADAIVLAVGAYRPYKRIHDVIAAACRLPGVRVVRVGPPGRGPYHRRCLAAARASRCDFVDLGPVPEADLPAYYAHADVLFYASEDEGFGFPPLEAMACGTTTVLSDIAAFRELHGDLAHYVNGDLAAAVGDALSRPLDPGRLRRHAASFTWDRTAASTASVYRRAQA